MSIRVTLSTTLPLLALFSMPTLQYAPADSLARGFLETAIPSARAWQHDYPPPPPAYSQVPARPYYPPYWIEMRRMEQEMRRRQWQMERDMERMEKEMLNEPYSSGVAIEEHFSTPRIRIEEDDTQFIVTALIPGADGKTIEVDQRGNRLRIAAMRKVEKRQTSDGKRISSSFSSRYQRILSLPGPVKEGSMQTDFSAEVLTIRIPKADS